MYRYLIGVGVAFLVAGLLGFIASYIVWLEYSNKVCRRDVSGPVMFISSIELLVGIALVIIVTVLKFLRRRR